MNENKRNERCTKGIGCDAQNCSYNENGDRCNAEHIDVSGKRAECTGETCCSTFRPKSV